MRREMDKPSFLATRPEGAKEFIKGRLEGWDCCGRCCQETGGAFTITLLQGEPAFRAFFKQATRGPQGARATVRDRGSLTSFSFRDGACMNHDIEEGRCREYGERPLVCRAFPFVFSLHRDVSLSAVCPALDDLREHGVLFMYESDFTGLPMLASARASMERLLAMFSRMLPESPIETLIDDERGERFYPIR